MRHVHQWPPIQIGEAATLGARQLWKYVSQHRRWMARQDPMRDNYLALHRVDAALSVLQQRVDARAGRQAPVSTLDLKVRRRFWQKGKAKP